MAGLFVSAFSLVVFSSCLRARRPTHLSLRQSIQLSLTRRLR